MIIISDTFFNLEWEEFFSLKNVQDRVRSWLLLSLEYYQEFGFFPQYSHLSKQGLENRIETIQKEFEQHLKDLRHPHTLDLFTFEELHMFYYEFVEINEQGEGILREVEYIPPCQDLFLLRWDKTRTWSEREVHCICPENKEYVKTIARWSEISRGSFLPQDIEEYWQPQSKSYTVEFNFNGSIHKIEVGYCEEDIDIKGLLNYINGLISTTGYEFVISEGLPNSRLVLVLTLEEEEKLRADKNLYFDCSFLNDYNNH
ncbi:hypothetical protein [Lusitaniella coriacea]|uniref:hypothetical protein n=1 Tax=Lusitaniella coriacea TaxID=1983105 RepID=UPI003CEE99E9